MGKASRRKRDQHGPRERTPKVPYVARPFAGLPGETDWVAMREILPAATAVATIADGVNLGTTHVTVATVLPLAWPGLHRDDGTLFIGTQSMGTSGDASRDLGGQLVATGALDAGTPLTNLPPITVETPRLQDLLDTEASFQVELHDGFDFWLEGADLDAESADSLERANASVVPTTAMAALPSAYWCQIGERTHIRLVLGDDEDDATDALARLAAADGNRLGENTALLGAFRACGLLVPVWDLDPALAAADYEDALAAWGTRYAEALAQTTPLDAAGRSARAGLVSRQVTLR